MSAENTELSVDDLNLSHEEMMNFDRASRVAFGEMDDRRPFPKPKVKKTVKKKAKKIKFERGKDGEIIGAQLDEGEE